MKTYQKTFPIFMLSKDKNYSLETLNQENILGKGTGFFIAKNGFFVAFCEEIVPNCAFYAVLYNNENQENLVEIQNLENFKFNEKNYLGFQGKIDLGNNECDFFEIENNMIEFLSQKKLHQELIKTIQNIGFKDEYQFALFRLLGIDQRLELSPNTEKNQVQVINALEKIGKNLTDYLHDELVAFLKEEINEFEQKIKFLEQKYQMSWEEMGQKFHELNQFGIIEKEDDYLDWVTYTDLRNASLKTLQKY